jgi:hypothetical protein
VFVPGLGEDRLGAWTVDDDGPIWPEEFLPTDIPNARILAYGYDKSKGLADYATHADHLCDQLQRLRRSTNTVWSGAPPCNLLNR